MYGKPISSNNYIIPEPTPKPAYFDYNYNYTTSSASPDTNVYNVDYSTPYGNF
jgi:hypothetical protein